MFRRVAIVAATAAFGAVGGVVPSVAAAAEPEWRCQAAPLSGTLLGQSLPVPKVGSLKGECVSKTLTPVLELPKLLRLEALSGVTKASPDAVSAAAGLVNLEVGSLPIPLDKLPVPESLSAIEVRLPGIEPAVATVDLSPAIQAIKSINSRKLLSIGVLASNVTGSCQDGQPVLTGQSRVLGGELLGLPIDGSGTVDTTVNLLDTENIPLDQLDLRLARVTLLDPTLNVETGAVLKRLEEMLGELPALKIPPQLAHVKLTGPTQERVDGMLVQRALRAQISLGGVSIADLSIARAAVGAGTACAPIEALACTKRKLTLIDVLPAGDRVRLFGAADRSLAGKTVNIVFQATGETVARVKVRRNGMFSTTAPMPSWWVRFTNRARYIARVGKEKSLNLKLMRRMVIDRVRSRSGRVTIVGRVIAPLATTPQTITLKRRVSCRKMEVVKRFKPAEDGTFRVTARAPKNVVTTTYRLETWVRESYLNPKLYPTYTLPYAVNL